MGAAVDLTFVCNVPYGNGTCRAVFSYENPADHAVHVPVGARNFVEPGPLDRGQATVFAPGMHYGAVSFTWNCREHAMARWNVRPSPVYTDTVVVGAALRSCPPLPLRPLLT